MNTCERFERQMFKVIKNVFDYDSYRLILSDDFFLRHSRNTRYSLRGYARDLGVSHGYLSELMSGKRELSIKKGGSVFRKLGFNEDELDFVESLIVLQNSKDHFLRQNALETFNHYFTKKGFEHSSENDKIMTSPVHFIIYSLLHEYSTLTEIANVAKTLNISLQKVEETLNHFVELNYVSFTEGSYLVLDPNRIINKHENYCQFLYELSQFFYDHYKKQNLNSLPKNVASCIIVPFDEETILEVRKLNQHYINGLFKISNRTGKVATKYCFVNNLYLEKDIDPIP